MYIQNKVVVIQYTDKSIQTQHDKSTLLSMAAYGSVLYNSASPWASKYETKNIKSLNSK